MAAKSGARPPKDDSELLDCIRGFIAEAADIPIEEVDPDVNIYETLGVDSLGAVSVFIDISYEFGIPEPDGDADFVELNTARKILDYIRAQEVRLV